MSLRPLTAGARLALVCSLAAVPASAQQGSGADPVIAARTLGYQGVEAYQSGNFVQAEQKLNRAYQLLPVPSLGLWSARALVKLGQLLQAAQRYREVGRSSLVAGDPAVQQEAKQDAERELSILLPTIPEVTLQLEGAPAGDVLVTINGLPLEQHDLSAPIPLNPGERVIEARSGEQRAQVRLTLHAGEHRRAVLVFGPSASAAARAEPAAALGLEQGVLHDPRLTALENEVGSWRTGGWVALGVGGSALLSSGVVGLLAWNKLDDFDCQRDPCVSSSADDVNTYNSLVRASTIGYLAGGLVAGVGVFLLLQYQTPEQDLTLGMGPLSASLRARF